ncbi:hypothetical protein [Catellatospora sp. TT07R-123]|nr:hypothetical protein [Catellatospora sp. TT07R-123]
MFEEKLEALAQMMTEHDEYATRYYTHVREMVLLAAEIETLRSE